MTNARALTARQLRELEAELLRERTRAERAMTAGARGAQPATVGGADTAVDYGDADGWLGIGTDARAQARHFAVTEALRRLTDGSYGRCLGCGSPIPFGRLLVMPEATHCVTCGGRA